MGGSTTRLGVVICLGVAVAAAVVIAGCAAGAKTIKVQLQSENKISANGPRSLAVAKDGKTVYMVPEGNRTKKVSSYIYKITLDNQGKVTSVQTSSYYFEYASPVKIALSPTSSNAYITVEGFDETSKVTKKVEDPKRQDVDVKKNGIYRVDLDKAFQPAGKLVGPFPKASDVSEFVFRCSLSTNLVIQLWGVSVCQAESSKTEEVVYVADALKRIWRFTFKKYPKLLIGGKTFKDIWSFAGGKTVVDESAKKESLLDRAFGLAADPNQANVLYISTAKGKLLKATITKAGTKITGKVEEFVGMSNRIGPVDLITATRTVGGKKTGWLFAVEEGEDGTAGKIRVVDLAKKKEVCEIGGFPLKEEKGGGKVQNLAAVSSIVFSSIRGLISQVSGNIVYSFDIEELWKKILSP